MYIPFSGGGQDVISCIEVANFWVVHFRKVCVNICAAGSVRLRLPAWVFMIHALLLVVGEGCRSFDASNLGHFDVYCGNIPTFSLIRPLNLRSVPACPFYVSTTITLVVSSLSHPHCHAYCNYPSPFRKRPTLLHSSYYIPSFQKLKERRRMDISCARFLFIT